MPYPPRSSHPPQRVAVIINPISGTGGRAAAAHDRVQRAEARLRQAGVDGPVSLTTHPGHARELAQAALAGGAATIIAWGGDGTVNEVASVAAFTGAALGIIPSGSGNGLARALRIPFSPDRAFDVALAGSSRIIDAGELDGRLFFNIAGIGLDARVAHRFAEDGLVHRGFKRYLAITFRELLESHPVDQTIVADGERIRGDTLLVAIANGPQYGNGAIVAPHAKVDDGKLDVVVIGYRAPWRALAQLPRVFTGGIARVPGVTIRCAAEVEVISGGHVLYHVDGEPGIGGVSLKASVHPRALRVAVGGGQ